MQRLLLCDRSVDPRDDQVESASGHLGGHRSDRRDQGVAQIPVPVGLRLHPLRERPDRRRGALRLRIERREHLVCTSRQRRVALRVRGESGPEGPCRGIQGRFQRLRRLHSAADRLRGVVERPARGDDGIRGTAHERFARGDQGREHRRGVRPGAELRRDRTGVCLEPGEDDLCVGIVEILGEGRDDVQSGFAERRGEGLVDLGGDLTRALIGDLRREGVRFLVVVVVDPDPFRVTGVERQHLPAERRGEHDRGVVLLRPRAFDGVFCGGDLPVQVVVRA